MLKEDSVTTEKRNKMLQIFGGSIAAFIIAVFTFTYAYGKQAQKVETIEKMVERRFDKIDNALYRLYDKLDDHTHYQEPRSNKRFRKNTR